MKALGAMAILILVFAVPTGLSIGLVAVIARAVIRFLEG